MSTMFELPEQLELPEADQSQVDDGATCDLLAESEGHSDATDLSAGDDQVEQLADETKDDPCETKPASCETKKEDFEPVHQPTVTPPQSLYRTSVACFDDSGELQDLLEQIRDAETDCRMAENRIESLKAEMKEAKGSYEKAVLDLRKLCSEAVRSKRDASTLQITTPLPESVEIKHDIQYDSTQPPFGGLVIQPEEPLNDAEPAASSTRDYDQDDIAWRSVPITELDLSAIKGLGQKKQEALIELCPTIGALEDLRSKVGRDAASLPELMPRGIGRAACDQLEELLLNWLAKRPVPIQELATSDDVASAIENLSHEDQVSQRAAELDDGKLNCLACKQKDDGIWKSGYRASEDDASIWECPWTAGDNQDEWIRGFLAQKAIGVYDRNQADRGNDLDEL